MTTMTLSQSTQHAIQGMQFAINHCCDCISLVSCVGLIMSDSDIKCALKLQHGRHFPNSGYPHKLLPAPLRQAAAESC
jgi:hypothetical protein